MRGFDGDSCETRGARFSGALDEFTRLVDDGALVTRETSDSLEADSGPFERTETGSPQLEKSTADGVVEFANQVANGWRPNSN